MTYSDAFNVRATSVKFNDVADALDGVITRGFAGTSLGTSTAYIVTPSPAWASYDTSASLSFIPHVTNTAGSPSVSITVNGLGAKAIKIGGADLTAGILIIGQPLTLTYTGVHFEITSIRTEQDAIWIGTTAGTGKDMTATAVPAVASYKVGQKYRMKIGPGLNSTNPSTLDHTLNINGVGIVNIVNNEDGTNLTAGTYVAGAIMEVVYDGTNFAITNDPGGWRSWTPTVVGIAPMTISALAIDHAIYRKQGKIVTIQYNINFTTAGTPSPGVSISLPVHAVHTGVGLLALGGTYDVAWRVAHIGWGTAAITHYFDISGGANYNIGSGKYATAFLNYRSV